MYYFEGKYVKRELAVNSGNFCGVTLQTTYITILILLLINKRLISWIIVLMSGSIWIKILLSFAFSYSKQTGANYMPINTLMTVTISLKKIYSSVLMKVLNLFNYHVLELKMKSGYIEVYVIQQ